MVELSCPLLSLQLGSPSFRGGCDSQTYGPLRDSKRRTVSAASEADCWRHRKCSSIVRYLILVISQYCNPNSLSRLMHESRAFPLTPSLNRATTLETLEEKVPTNTLAADNISQSAKISTKPEYFCQDDKHQTRTQHRTKQERTRQNQVRQDKTRENIRDQAGKTGKEEREGKTGYIGRVRKALGGMAEDTMLFSYAAYQNHSVLGTPLFDTRDKQTGFSRHSLR